MPTKVSFKGTMVRAEKNVKCLELIFVKSLPWPLDIHGSKSKSISF